MRRGQKKARRDKIGCGPSHCMKRGTLGVDSAHGAGVYACPAVDAGICSDCPLVAGFADGVNRARIVACSAVDAFVGNCMCQSVHLPHGTILRLVFEKL